MEKKAILLVSFGTSAKAALESCIDPLINRIKQEFPSYEVKNIFTSAFILSRLQGRDNIYSLKDALEELVREEYSEVIIQPTLLTAGDEYEQKILKIANLYEKNFASLRIGEPLIEAVNDIQIFMRAFQLQIGRVENGEEIVFMGHGSRNHRSDIYVKLQEGIDEVCRNITIGVLEDEDAPNFAAVLHRLKRKKIEKVFLMPLMFVAGMHVKKDLLNGEHAWYYRLVREGFSVRVYEKGLGENRKFQDIYLSAIKTIMKDSGK